MGGASQLRRLPVAVANSSWSYTLLQAISLQASQPVSQPAGYITTHTDILSQASRQTCLPPPVPRHKHLAAEDMKLMTCSGINTLTRRRHCEARQGHMQFTIKLATAGHTFLCSIMNSTASMKWGLKMRPVWRYMYRSARQARCLEQHYG